jgi:hypothetical protein
MSLTVCEGTVCSAPVCVVTHPRYDQVVTGKYEHNASDTERRGNRVVVAAIGSDLIANVDHLVSFMSYACQRTVFFATLSLCEDK